MSLLEFDHRNTILNIYIVYNSSIHRERNGNLCNWIGATNNQTTTKPRNPRQ